MDSTRSRVACLLAASAFLLLPIVLAGTAGDPEIADPEGDVLILDLVPDITLDPAVAGGLFARGDIVATWFEDADTDVLIHLQTVGDIGGGFVGPVATTIFNFNIHMTVGETEYIAGAFTTFESITPDGVAAGARAEANVLTLTVPKTELGVAEGGLLASLFSESAGGLVTDPLFIASDRAPDADFGRDFDLGGGTGPCEVDGLVDSDCDGLPDDWEMEHFGNLDEIASGDPDADDCTNACEYSAGTDPNNPDTDGDGDTDGAEIACGSDPLDPTSTCGGPGCTVDGEEDSDCDGLPDNWEIDNFGNLDMDGDDDPDGDGCDNLCEYQNGTDPNAADTDGDGDSDGKEVDCGSDPLDPASTCPPPGCTVDGNEDSDCDGLPDNWELGNFGDLDEDGTGDPDGDGCDNLCEYENGTDPNDADTDGEGLSDGDEVTIHNTDPNDADTDNDGDTDFEEVECGSNPLSSSQKCSDLNNGRDWQSPLGDLGYLVLSSLLLTAVIAISLIGLFGRWS